MLLNLFNALIQVIERNANFRSCRYSALSMDETHCRLSHFSTSYWAFFFQKEAGSQCFEGGLISLGAHPVSCVFNVHKMTNGKGTGGRCPHFLIIHLVPLPQVLFQNRYSNIYQYFNIYFQHGVKFNTIHIDP